jgi:hypothetical protein
MNQSGQFCLLHLCAGRLAAARRIASTDRSTSSVVVDQLDTEILIAAFPCQVVPPSQQIPSSCTSFTTARVRASWCPVAARGLGVPVERIPFTAL